MTDKVGVYGEFAVGPKGAVPSIHANEIMGFRVGRSPDGQPAGIDLQFRSLGQPHSVTIPILQALALLSMLKAFQLNEDLPFPEDPRVADWKASDYKSKA